jgi:hypothetical protein
MSLKRPSLLFRFDPVPLNAFAVDDRAGRVKCQVEGFYQSVIGASRINGANAMTWVHREGGLS